MSATNWMEQTILHPLNGDEWQKSDCLECSYRKKAIDEERLFLSNVYIQLFQF